MALHLCLTSVRIHCYSLLLYSAHPTTNPPAGSFADTGSPRRDELWSAVSEPRSTEREIWVTIIQRDVAGEDEDHDGSDESGIIRTSTRGWVRPALRLFALRTTTQIASPSVTWRRICRIVSLQRVALFFRVFAAILVFSVKRAAFLSVLHSWFYLIKGFEHCNLVSIQGIGALVE